MIGLPGEVVIRPEREVVIRPDGQGSKITDFLCINLFLGMDLADSHSTERKVKTINRNAFKNEIQTLQTPHQTTNRSPNGGEYKENYCQVYSNGSSNSISMSTSTEYFEKGSLIALEDGQCKKIEDLKKEDFLLVRFT